MIDYEGSKRWTDYDAIKRVINSGYGRITDCIISQSVDEPMHIDLSIEPYSARIDADGRVRTNNEKLNKEFEEIKEKLTKSILDEYGLSYIDTDMAATMVATTTDIATKEEFGNHIKEALKNYILEGNKMQFKRGAYELAWFSSAPITNKYNVKKIIHSGLWTIVTWEDGTLTKVKMEDDGHYDEYAAFTAALAKKVYGNNSKVHKILETKTVEQKKSKKKEGSKC